MIPKEVRELLEQRQAAQSQKMKTIKIEIPKDSDFVVLTTTGEGVLKEAQFEQKLKYGPEDVAKLEGKFMDIKDLKGEGIWVWVTNSLGEQGGIKVEDYLLWKEMEKEVGNPAEVELLGTILKTKYVTVGIYGTVFKECDWNHAKNSYQLPDRVQGTEIGNNFKEINKVRKLVGLKEFKEGWFWTSGEYSSYLSWGYLSGGLLSNYSKSNSFGVIACKDLSELKPEEEEETPEEVWEELGNIFEKMFGGK